MRKLVMCQGLPGSGKSTWAQSYGWDSSINHGHVFVVNKDAIRTKLEESGWAWSRENEGDVIAERDRRIVHYLTNYENVTVVSDDTNYGRKHKVALEAIARACGANFEVKKFDTPIDECIRRDSLRVGKACVGEAVIRRMAKQHDVQQGYPPAVPLLTPEDAPYAIICDLDGTLSLLNGRNPYDASTADQDVCNEPVRNLLEVYYRTQHYDIIYLSGREDKYRPQTETFMRLHHCPPGRIFMRTTGDHRKDWVVKGELFDAHVRGQYNVKFVLDDRNQVVDYWRHIGLTCFQVALGNF